MKRVALLFWFLSLACYVEGFLDFPVRFGSSRRNSLRETERMMGTVCHNSASKQSGQGKIALEEKSSSNKNPSIAEIHLSRKVFHLVGGMYFAFLRNSEMTRESFVKIFLAYEGLLCLVSANAQTLLT